MAGGWSKDGAVQDQIDASIADAVKLAQSQLPKGEGLTECEECDTHIPKARRQAIIGVRLCVNCQHERDTQQEKNNSFNRRGSKGSQLR